MQVPVGRNGLTADQVRALIRDSSTLHVSSGLQLVDVNLNVLADFVDDFQGGSVTRDAYSTLHGTAQLVLAQELDWGTAIVRPYMTLSDGVVSATFNLGAYLTSSPRTEAGETPRTHSIDGYDILHWLNTPVGASYVVPAGQGYLDAAEQVLLNQGIAAYQIDQTAAASVLPVPKVWALDTQTTWLNIVNDLLAAVGYLGLWSDWDGNLRMSAYDTPIARTSEWFYSTDAAVSMLTPRRSAIHDLFNAPNKWVFYWSKDPSGAQPVEGAGVYTFQNDNVGDTSVDARGRIITAPPQQVDVVDQAALVLKASQYIDTQLQVRTTIEAGTSPNPLHWHFDRLTLDDAELGRYVELLGTKWTLPLDGSDMTHQWTRLT